MPNIPDIPLWESQRGVLLLTALGGYVLMFAVTLISFVMAIPEAGKELLSFVAVPLGLYGTLLTIGFTFFYKDKAAEAVANAEIAKARTEECA